MLTCLVSNHLVQAMQFKFSSWLLRSNSPSFLVGFCHLILHVALNSSLTSSIAKITKPLSDETSFSFQTVLGESTGQCTPHLPVRCSPLKSNGR